MLDGIKVREQLTTLLSGRPIRSLKELSSLAYISLGTYVGRCVTAEKKKKSLSTLNQMVRISNFEDRKENLNFKK